jgi:hypothetical protein
VTSKYATEIIEERQLYSNWRPSCSLAQFRGVLPQERQILSSTALEERHFNMTWRPSMAHWRASGADT